MLKPNKAFFVRKMKADSCKQCYEMAREYGHLAWLVLYKIRTEKNTMYIDFKC